MPWSADVVIVGSGVAGSLASQLAWQSASLKVLILEAGPRVDRAAALEQYRGALIKIPEAPYPDTPTPRARRATIPTTITLQDGSVKFGSTLPTAGRRNDMALARHHTALHPRRLQAALAIRRRPSTWPLSYDDLEPWYCEAEQELGVAGDPKAALDARRSSPYPLPAIPMSYLDQRVAAALKGTPHKVEATPQARNSASLRQPSDMLRKRQLHPHLPHPGEVRRHIARGEGPSAPAQRSWPRRSSRRSRSSDGASQRCA